MYESIHLLDLLDRAYLDSMCTVVERTTAGTAECELNMTEQILKKRITDEVKRQIDR